MAVKTATAVKKVRELTEEEILKAPEKDYMNEAQLLFFKKQLLELRDQLLQNADDTGEHLRENEVTTDPSDRATLEEEYTLELRTRDRERKLLKKVEKSLRMIDDGSYGWCEETGEPIGVPRLIARPDGHAVARSAGAPRARAEALRGLIPRQPELDGGSAGRADPATSVAWRRDEKRGITLGAFVAATGRMCPRCDQPPAMKNSMGMDSITLVRDARKAVRRALAFSSSVAGFMPRIFCWLGQMSAQTLMSMIVPSQAPTPMPAIPFDNVKAATNWLPSNAAPASHVTTAAQRK